MNVYQRECPCCKTTQIFNSRQGLWMAKKYNTLCYSCAKSGFKHSEESKKKISKNRSGKLIGINNPFYKKNHSVESRQKISSSKIGKLHTEEHKTKTSLTCKKRYFNTEEKRKTSISVTLALHKPDIRKKHLGALHRSQWLKVKTDKGQLELIEKWNKLGFNFEPNYQVKTDFDLFYIDGYDQKHNIVLEYDSKYHQKINQKQKDLVRQNKIIEILRPKKFWRYDSTNKKFKSII